MTTTVAGTATVDLESAVEAVELVLCGIGEIAQAQWHEDNPEPMTEWERLEEMAVQRYERDRDEGLA